METLGQGSEYESLGKGVALCFQTHHLLLPKTAVPLSCPWV